MTLNWQDNKRFQKLSPFVFSVEGGYVWDKKDPGGATNHGVAYNYNAGWVKRYGINSPHQMITLTKEQAMETYFLRYWVPSQADEINDDRLALAYFDHAINAGPGAADSILLKLGTGHWHIEGNGKNVNFFWGQTLQYMLQRLWWYIHIRNWGTYKQGWFNRLINISKSLSKV